MADVKEWDLFPTKIFESKFMIACFYEINVFIFASSFNQTLSIDSNITI